MLWDTNLILYKTHVKMKIAKGKGEKKKEKKQGCPKNSSHSSFLLFLKYYSYTKINFFDRTKYFIH